MISAQDFIELLDEVNLDTLKPEIRDGFMQTRKAFSAWISELKTHTKPDGIRMLGMGDVVIRRNRFGQIIKDHDYERSLDILIKILSDDFLPLKEDKKLRNQAIREAKQRPEGFRQETFLEIFKQKVREQGEGKLSNELLRRIDLDEALELGKQIGLFHTVDPQQHKNSVISSIVKKFGEVVGGLARQPGRVFKAMKYGNLWIGKHAQFKDPEVAEEEIRTRFNGSMKGGPMLVWFSSTCTGVDHPQTTLIVNASNNPITLFACSSMKNIGSREMGAVLSGRPSIIHIDSTDLNPVVAENLRNLKILKKILKVQSVNEIKDKFGKFKDILSLEEVIKNSNHRDIDLGLFRQYAKALSQKLAGAREQITRLQNLEKIEKNLLDLKETLGVQTIAEIQSKFGVYEDLNQLVDIIQKKHPEIDSQALRATSRRILQSISFEPHSQSERVTLNAERLQALEDFDYPLVVLHIPVDGENLGVLGSNLGSLGRSLTSIAEWPGMTEKKSIMAMITGLQLTLGRDKPELLYHGSLFQVDTPIHEEAKTTNFVCIGVSGTGKTPLCAKNKILCDDQFIMTVEYDSSQKRHIASAHRVEWGFLFDKMEESQAIKDSIEGAEGLDPVIHVGVGFEHIAVIEDEDGKPREIPGKDVRGDHKVLDRISRIILSEKDIDPYADQQSFDGTNWISIDGKEVTVASANRRALVGADNCPPGVLSPEFYNPKGVEPDVFMYGTNNHESTTPLLFVIPPAKDGSASASEQTAFFALTIEKIKTGGRETGAGSEEARDSYGIDPFNWHRGEYAAKSHEQFSILEKEGHGLIHAFFSPRKVMNLWPKSNADQALVQCLHEYRHGIIEFVPNPYGLVPKFEDLRKCFADQGIEYTQTHYKEHFEVDEEKAIQDIQKRKKFLKEEIFPDDREKKLVFLRKTYNRLVRDLKDKLPSDKKEKKMKDASSASSLRDGGKNTRPQTEIDFINK